MRGARIAILGYGREGKSVLKFLKVSRKYRGAKIQILDKRRNPHYLRHLSDFDIIFRSPGVPLNLPAIRAAAKTGTRVTSATKLFFELCRSPIIGVTGTKGKGTTANLIYQILKSAGRRVVLAGNIGTSPLTVLPKITSRTLVVLELSSFQLWDLKQSPSVAVITDIFPDHQDVHKNMREYVSAKANIARYQKKSDAICYLAANPLAEKVASQSRGKKISVSAPNTLEKNGVLAEAVCAALGAPEKVIGRVLKNQKGLAHRLELAQKMNGISFYDDSASTNPHAAAAAVVSFDEPMILVAGGKDKNLDYAPLAVAIKKSGFVRFVILIGENREKIAIAIKKSGPTIKFAPDLIAAIQLAHNCAGFFKIPVILFSPGSASLDMFADYADRGNKFKKLCAEISRTNTYARNE